MSLSDDRADAVHALEESRASSVAADRMVEESREVWGFIRAHQGPDYFADAVRAIIRGAA